MMTRKHYEKVAEIVKEATTRAKFAKELAEMFAEDNPRFDEARFYIACGVGIV